MDNVKGLRMEVLKPAWVAGKDYTRGGISRDARWLTLTHIVRRDPRGRHFITLVPSRLRSQSPSDREPAVWLVICEDGDGKIENVFLVPAGDGPAYYVGRYMAGGNYAAFSVARHEWQQIRPDIGEAFRIHDHTEHTD